jgi:hypothetical protein
VSTVGANLRRSIGNPQAWSDKVVAVYEMKGAGPLPDRKRFEELAFFYTVVLELGKGSMRLREHRVLDRRVFVYYDAQAVDVALEDAHDAQLRVSRHWEKVPWSLSVGIATGVCLAFQGPNGLDEFAGAVIDHAAMLADIAQGEEVLVEAAAAGRDRAERELPASFGKMRQAKRIPFKFQEFFWSGEPTGSKAGPETRSGTLVRWDEGHGRGLVVTEDGDRFYADRRHLAVGSSPEEGARVFFVDEDPIGSPEGNRLAAAAVVVGDRIDGRVTMVDLSQGYAFVEVRDAASFSQHLITARSTNLEDLSVDSTVEFFVDENARGATAAAIRIVDRSGGTLSGNNPPIAARFIAALTSHLRRQGASGAAAAVLRQASLDWVPANASPGQQHAEALALARFAVDNWARRGVRDIGEGTLALGLLQDTAHSFSPHILERDVAAIRKQLKARPDYAGGGANPVTPQAVAAVLTEVQLGLRELGTLEGEELSPTAVAAVAKATEHFGYALSHAFRGGIVTSLPPEAIEALTALHNA